MPLLACDCLCVLSSKATGDGVQIRAGYVALLACERHGTYSLGLVFAHL